MAATTMAPVSKTMDDSVQITLEDQQMINSFARKNSRLNDMKDEVEKKKKDLQNLADAEDEMMLLDADEDTVPMRMGEVFVNLKVSEAQEYVDKNKEDLKTKVDDLERKCSVIEKQLSDLKVRLYGKFGDNINLEKDDE